MAIVFLAVNSVPVFIYLLFDGLAATSIVEESPPDALFVAASLISIVGPAIYVATYVPTVVFFCMWLHRVVRNMPSLGSTDPRWTPGGAVGRCFIPFLNFVHPLFSVVDAWRGSSPRLRLMDEWVRRSERVPLLIVGWWAAWLLARVTSGVAMEVEKASDFNTKLVGVGIDAVGQLVLITAAVLAILVVRQLTTRQNLKFQLIASGQLV